MRDQRKEEEVEEVGKTVTLKQRVVLLVVFWLQWARERSVRALATSHSSCSMSMSSVAKRQAGTSVFFFFFLRQLWKNKEK